MDLAGEISDRLNLGIIQGEILFKPESHEYFHIPTNKKLTPVSRVIQVVYNLKSWDGVDPAVIERARWRGIGVDYYMAQYVKNGEVRIDPEESPDVRARVIDAHRVWEEEFSGLPAEPQKIVYSLVDGIAGTVDFWVDSRIIVDLKATWAAEKAWLLQLGAYCEYAPTPPERCGIIHVNKQGGKWMEYNVESCRSYWRHAVAWWKETQDMKR